MKNKKISESIRVMEFFTIYFEKKIKDSDLSLITADEIKKLDMNKVINVRTSDSPITTENWHKRKDIFFKQRMENYKDSYTLNEKIALELKKLEKFEFTKQDRLILKDRYKKYLTVELEKPTALHTVKTEFKDFFNSDIKTEIIDKIQNDCKAFIGKDMAYLIYLLDVEFGFITYTLNGKTDGRIHFVKALNKSIKSMQGINKYFDSNSKELDGYKLNKDPRFIKVKNIISKAIE